MEGRTLGAGGGGVETCAFGIGSGGVRGSAFTGGAGGGGGRDGAFDGPLLSSTCAGGGGGGGGGGAGSDCNVMTARSCELLRSSASNCSGEMAGIMSGPSRPNEKLSIEESLPSPPNCEPKPKLKPLESSGCCLDTGSGLPLSIIGAMGGGGGAAAAAAVAATSWLGSG